MEKDPWHRCFPVNFVKFLRTPLVAASVGGSKAMMQVFWVWFLKSKQQDTRVSYNKDSVIQRWAEKRKKRKKTKRAKQTTNLNLLEFNCSNEEKQKQLSCVSYWLRFSCAKLISREKRGKRENRDVIRLLFWLFCNRQYYYRNESLCRYFSKNLPKF